MGWLEAIVLGIVQGLTEFLPVSSSAHLRVLPEVFGWADPGASFSAVTQLGTVAAVLLFFWRDLVSIARGWFTGIVNKAGRTQDYRFGWFMIVGTVPISVIGFLGADSIRTVLRDLRITAIALIVMGLVLYLVDKRASSERAMSDVGLREAILVGCAQAAALIPGVSRSGATITMARGLGLNRESAARFSFLLSIPAVVLSAAYEALNIGTSDTPAWGPTFVATAVAFVVGYASIAWFIKWLGGHGMGVFAAYRGVLGAAILIAVTIGAVAPR